MIHILRAALDRQMYVGKRRAPASSVIVRSVLTRVVPATERDRVMLDRGQTESGST